MLGPVEDWPPTLLAALEVIRTSRFPMVIAWGPGRFAFYNDAFAPILSGKTKTMGSPLDETFSEAWHVIGSAFMRAEAGESVYCEDLQVPITRNGKTEASWWTLSYSPLTTATGEVGGVLGVILDTTRARRAQLREQAGKDELGKITDVPSLLWRSDRFGRLVWQSRRLKTLALEFPAETGSLWRRLIHPDDLEGVLAELGEAKLQRREFARQLRVKVSSSEYRWHQARSEPVFDATGAISGWCGVATDVQDSRTALEVIGDREALFSQFAANSAGYLWTVDLATLEIERLSPNFDRLWPRSESRAPWMWFEFIALVHEQDRLGLQEGFDRARRGEVVHGRFRVGTETQGFRHFEGTMFPIINAQGKVACLGGILDDVTPEFSHLVRLIDADPGDQNRLWHELRQAGLNVMTYSSVSDLVRSASISESTPILYRHWGEQSELDQLAHLARSALRGTPWLVIHDEVGSSRGSIDMMKMGAADVLTGEASWMEISAALMTAASLTKNHRPEAAGHLLAISQLTPREHQVLDGLVAGGTNKSIAIALNLSPRTVESHRSRLMERLGVTSLAELVALATGHPRAN